MMKKFKQQMKNEKGLTLIELLAVIVILAIIAAIAIPAIGNIIENSKVNALKADGQNVLAAGNLYFIENSTLDSVTLDTLITDGFIEDAGGFANTSGSGATGTTVTKATTGNTISGKSASSATVSVTFLLSTNADITNAGVKAGTEGTVTIAR
ncbi:prepilin-type N-terminal cleavage/methylation domain-containing protein [Sporosarcina sp. FSL K6-3457]|uniref:prepilin-type N-terminal cleavage/methylation domain-containing protein n=1 Tax=Sporosarcina sp. FSL K6-3457 TaxID=2978204 RepID=UPI0030FA7949